MAIYRIELSRSVGLQLLAGGLLLGGLLFTGGTVVGYSLAAAGEEAPPAATPDAPAPAPAIALVEADPREGALVAAPDRGAAPGAPAAAPPLMGPPAEPLTPPVLEPVTADADVAWAPVDPTAPPWSDPAGGSRTGASRPALEPDPGSAAEPAGPSGRYAVQVGAFRVKGNADALASSLRSRGYDPLVVRARSRSGQWLEHVHLSVHPGERLAQDVARSFTSRERLPAIVVAVTEPGSERE